MTRLMAFKFFIWYSFTKVLADNDENWSIDVSSMMSDAAGSIFLPPQLEDGGIIPSHESDDIPDSADNVQPDLLNSGVAVYLGMNLI